jgi:tetratricopeptide (TPR) repeat protein
MNRIAVIALLALLLIAPAGIGADDGLLLLFQQGNEAYDRGNFDLALANYAQLARYGVRDGRLYYNMGNCYYRKDDVGRAVLFYLRASRMLPRDPDVAANLALARARTQDKLPAVEPFWAIRLAGWPYFHLSHDELVAAASGAYLLFFAVLLIRILSRRDPVRRWCRNLILLSGALLLLFGANVLARIHDDSARVDAVIVADEAAGRSGPGETFTEIFRLHAGAEVVVHNRRDSWVQVALSNGMAGWLPTDVLDEVAGSSP